MGEGHRGVVLRDGCSSEFATLRCAPLRHPPGNPLSRPAHVRTYAYAGVYVCMCGYVRHVRETFILLFCKLIQYVCCGEEGWMSNLREGVKFMGEGGQRG